MIPCKMPLLFFVFGLPYIGFILNKKPSKKTRLYETFFITDKLYNESYNVLTKTKKQS